jgi:hypothetical protein
MTTGLPSTPVFTANTPVYAPLLRASVADAVALLTRRPWFCGQDSSAPSIPSGANTALGWNAELADTWNGHSTNSGTAAATYYCQLPGWYLCRLAVPWANGSTAAEYQCGFSGTTSGTTFTATSGPIYAGGSGHDPVTECVDLIEQVTTGAILGTGDYLQAWCSQNSGSAVTLAATAVTLPYVSVRWVAATAGTTGLAVPSNPAWPSPASYVQSAFGNTSISQAIEFLLYPPICKATYSGSSVTLPSTTFPAGTVIDLNTVTVDNYSGYTTGASGGYTAPVAGLYTIAGQISLAAQSGSATGYCAGLQVNHSGTTQWGDSVWVPFLGSAPALGAAVCKRLRLNAGDFVQLMGCQGSAGGVLYSSAAQNPTRMIAVWEGA